MATSGIHPKWISCFPGGVHHWDDGTPDPEEEEERPVILTRTLFTRDGSTKRVDVLVDTETLTWEELPLSDRLTEMGF